MPFGYVGPEQLIRDRSEYARKGIARGRSVLAAVYRDGILFVAENPNPTLHKVSEIYDRLAFAAVGRYNEFENMRVAGVRYADTRGYAYDRRDVTGRGLANAYAQTLGTIFIESNKPYEVEIIVAEVGAGPAEDQMYRVTYDGSVADERGFVAMGGHAEAITTALRENHDPELGLAAAVTAAVQTLEAASPPIAGVPARLGVGVLEVAVLDRTRPRRRFKRVSGAQLEAIVPAVPAQTEETGRGPER